MKVEIIKQVILEILNRIDKVESNRLNGQMVGVNFGEVGVSRVRPMGESVERAKIKTTRKIKQNSWMPQRWLGQCGRTDGQSHFGIVNIVCVRVRLWLGAGQWHWSTLTEQYVVRSLDPHTPQRIALACY